MAFNSMRTYESVFLQGSGLNATLDLCITHFSWKYLVCVIFIRYEQFECRGNEAKDHSTRTLRKTGIICERRPPSLILYVEILFFHFYSGPNFDIYTRRQRSSLYSNCLSISWDVVQVTACCFVSFSSVFCLSIVANLIHVICTIATVISHPLQNKLHSAVLAYFFVSLFLSSPVTHRQRLHFCSSHIFFVSCLCEVVGLILW